MINFSHKPCISDGKNSITIAKRLKEKAQINTNYLDFLLKKRLDTKLMPSLELKQIKDFPKLKINEIKERICFGSFQLKQSKSYLTDLINRVKAYKISELLIKEIRDLNLRRELITKIRLFLQQKYHQDIKEVESKQQIKKTAFPKMIKNSKQFIRFLYTINLMETVMNQSKVKKYLTVFLYLLILI
jgi:hypothetical protein